MRFQCGPRSCSKRPQCVLNAVQMRPQCVPNASPVRPQCVPNASQMLLKLRSKFMIRCAAKKVDCKARGAEAAGLKYLKIAEKIFSASPCLDRNCYDLTNVDVECQLQNLTLLESSKFFPCAIFLHSSANI